MNFELKLTNTFFNCEKKLYFNFSVQLMLFYSWFSYFFVAILSVSANKRSLSMEYLPYMRNMLSSPLANEGAAAVESVIARLDAYDLMREDFDSIMDLTSWSSSANAMEKIESKVISSVDMFSYFKFIINNCYDPYQRCAK